MTEIGELKWFFNKTVGISDKKILKENFLNALKKTDGSPVSALDNIPFEKVKSLFPDDELLDQSNYLNRLLKNLEKDEYFDKIVEIVE